MYWLLIANYKELFSMKLSEGIIGRTYRVDSVAVNETITRRLEALGVNSMTPVTL